MSTNPYRELATIAPMELDPVQKDLERIGLEFEKAVSRRVQLTLDSMLEGYKKNPDLLHKTGLHVKNVYVGGSWNIFARLKWILEGGNDIVLSWDDVKDTRFGAVLKERAEKLGIGFKEENGYCYGQKLVWLFLEDMKKHGYKPL